MTIRVVMFDLDDTLFAHAAAVRSGVLAHIAHALPTADGPAELGRWHQLEETHYLRYLTGELDFLGQRRARARAFLEPYGIELAADAEAEEWFDRYAVEYRRAWTLHDDALPCLDALERDIPGVRFGIITNGDIDFQSDKIADLGIGSRFEVVIASGSLGYAKPDPRIFRHACEEFGVSPAEAAYVGDRLQTDAIGAASAGLTGVWLDRGAAGSPADLDAASRASVRVIHGLAQLTAAL